MTLYKFTGTMNAEVEGEVYAENEAEAREIIEQGQFDYSRIIGVDEVDDIKLEVG